MSNCPFHTRRGFLGLAGAAVGGSAIAGLGFAKPSLAKSSLDKAETNKPSEAADADQVVPFHGMHQAGIGTPRQNYVAFAAFDLITDDVAEIVKLLQAWTKASERLTAGQMAEPSTGDPTKPPADSGETLGMSPRRLTLTFGFGPGLFEKDGKDRYHLKAKRPAALVDLPRFNGDQLEPELTGGDLCIQACADDGSVAFHAVRQLARIAAPNDAGKGYGGKQAGATVAYGAKKGVAVLRWMQSGFLPAISLDETPRNLLGFKDGTQNPGKPYPAERSGGKIIGNGTMDEVVWVGGDNDWMSGGSYLVARRIRLALEHWDQTELDFQEQVIGRRKVSGGPLSGGDEYAPLDLDAVDSDGNPLIPENAHARLGAAAANGGARVLRRSYSYDNGLSMVAERWPPWRQGLEYDAGLLFLAYQRDPRTGFIQIFDTMSKLDFLNQYATHIGSGIFACPGGVAPGEFVGQKLFGAA